MSLKLYSLKVIWCLIDPISPNLARLGPKKDTSSKNLGYYICKKNERAPRSVSLR